LKVSDPTALRQGEGEFTPPPCSNFFKHQGHNVHEDSLDTGFLFLVSSQARPLSFQLRILSTFPRHIFSYYLPALRGLSAFAGIDKRNMCVPWSYLTQC
jgi:hypothetical protein